MWNERTYSVPVSWSPESGPPPSAQPVRIYSDPASGDPLVLSANAMRLGRLESEQELNPNPDGLITASVLADQTGVEVKYIGPDDLWRVGGARRT